uniref:E3 ubiquitin-protein ligase TRIM39-like n=1 Tax=Geotrypetes seraphini TaxID=260995 RepID=A0A6P8R392_GEOSA|nr:E3 ubiquitin-protein ligase TRIM39-like [Geotrypetes seraphini]
MAATKSAECLQKEASCSICLDYFTDPVLTDCGHNFCRSCITQSWEGKFIFLCPQCRKRSLHRNLRPNMTEMVKNLHQNSEEPKEEIECEKHNEKLKLFCEEDQKPICVVCDKSREHRYHTVVPMEEVVQKYKKKLKMHLDPLRKNLEGFLKFQSTERKKAEELRVGVCVSPSEPVEAEFEELHQFLNKQKQVLLWILEKEEEQILQRIRENATQAEEQSSFVMQLILKIKEKNHKLMVTRLISWTTSCGRYGVDVTLDPQTAHPKLIVSEDRKSVSLGNTRQNLPDHPERFDTGSCVLGCEGFTKGIHYWEVEVGDGTDWILGVCKHSVRRKGEIKLLPGEGYWLVGLWGGQGYVALGSHVTRLSPSEIPRAVGILLEYEAGKVSFYDADYKSHLLTFRKSHQVSSLLGFYIPPIKVI